VIHEYNGGFYVPDYCKRCLSLFYTYAMQNVPLTEIGRAFGEAYKLCPWCKGECTAAEQDHQNALIESMYKENLS
jgi:hypothetical protein